MKINKRSPKRSPKFLLLLFPILFLLCKPGLGQAVPVAPDCQLFFSFSTTGTTANLDNRFVGCVTWTVQYTNTGFSGLTLTFQSANGATAPGTFSTYAGTVVTGAAVMTSTTGEVSTFSNGTVNIPWVNVKLSGLTGSGSVTGVMYGYRSGSTGGSGAGGCPGTTGTPCVVDGVTAAGSPPTTPPVLIGGQDGTNVQTVKTDTAGDQRVVGSAPPGSAAGDPLTIGYKDDSSNALSAFAFPDQAAFTVTGTDVVIVTGTASKKTYVGHLSLTLSAAQTVTIQQGTGSTCGTSTLVIFGPYPSVSALALDFDSAGGLHTTVNANDLCIHLGGSATMGGGVTYGVH